MSADNVPQSTAEALTVLSQNLPTVETQAQALQVALKLTNVNVESSAPAVTTMMQIASPSQMQAQALQIAFKASAVEVRGTGAAVTVLTQPIIPSPVSHYTVEALAAGFIANDLQQVTMEVVAGIPYDISSSNMTIEVLAETTTVPPKPMQKIVWFMPN